MQLDYPDLGDKTASEEGTVAHAVLAAYLGHGDMPAGATEEMHDGAMLVLSNLPPGVREWRVEQRLKGRRIHDSQNWGTPDLVGWADMHLHGIDYKFGHGYVDHVANLQIINYLALELERAEIDGLVEQAITVSIHVAQPRAFGHEPFRTWTVPATDLRPYVNQLREAATRATRLDRKGTTGPQCDHCNGRHACAALAAVSWRAVDMSSGSLPMEIKPAAMGTELAILQAAQRRLSARITGIEAQVAHHVKSGTAVAGWRMESGLGHRKWSLPDDQVVGLLGGAVAKHTVITPAQAVKAGLDASLVDAVTQREPTAAKLVQSDEKLAARVFR